MRRLGSPLPLPENELHLAKTDRRGIEKPHILFSNVDYTPTDVWQRRYYESARISKVLIGVYAYLRLLNVQHVWVAQDAQ